MKNTLEMQFFYDYFLKLKKRLAEIFPQTRKKYNLPYSDSGDNNCYLLQQSPTYTSFTPGICTHKTWIIFIQ